MPLVDDFFKDIDRLWTRPADPKICLRIIGSSALMLQTDYERGTKDSDVLETSEITIETKHALLALAGESSGLCTRHRLYLEFVSNGIPFLPQIANYHRPQVNEKLQHFELQVLDVVDVVVSKLKRFSPNDRGDIEAMIEKDLVPHSTLVTRFRAAVDMYSGDARAEDLPMYVDHLHVVERDFLSVEESVIELPEWIAD